jgi:hypothetical protein
VTLISSIAAGCCAFAVTPKQLRDKIANLIELEMVFIFIGVVAIFFINFISYY